MKTDSHQKVTRVTLERYLSGSGLSDSQRKELLEEHDKTGGDRAVLNKAVRLSGRKCMSKVPSVTGRK